LKWKDKLFIGKVPKIVFTIQHSFDYLVYHIDISIITILSKINPNYY